MVWIAGIAGMIAGSIADNNGVAVTFGLITAAATLGLILVTASAGPGAFDPPTTDQPAADDPTTDDGSLDESGRAVEDQVARLTAAGADEAEVRELVRRAVALGRRVRGSGR